MKAALDSAKTIHIKLAIKPIVSNVLALLCMGVVISVLFFELIKASIMAKHKTIADANSKGFENILPNRFAVDSVSKVHNNP